MTATGSKLRADHPARGVKLARRFTAEFTNGGANPRFIVTNVHAAFGSPRFLYETVYCQRGEMENRLKECQGELFADRTPTPPRAAVEIGGRKGLDPTRYGDWEKNGRCIDF